MTGSTNLPSVAWAAEWLSQAGSAWLGWMVFAGNFVITIILLSVGLSMAVAMVGLVFNFWTRS